MRWWRRDMHEFMVIFFFLSDDPKNGHLKEMEGGKERLTLHKVDLLDIDSVRAAIHGCHGVFHTASPVTDNPVSYFSFSPSIQFFNNLFQSSSLSNYGLRWNQSKDHTKWNSTLQTESCHVIIIWTASGCGSFHQILFF